MDQRHPDLSLPSLEADKPFRLGTTSYIVPDDILPNVRVLAGLVDDVELVLFESDEISNLPDEKTIGELAQIAEKNDLTYTIHLPLDINLGTFEEAERIRSVKKCLRAIKITEKLDPFAYVLHFHGDLRGGKASCDPERWRSGLSQSIGELLDTSRLDASMICVETLDYPIEMIADLIENAGFSVCLDVGHLLLYGYPITPILERHWPRIRVIHLHGIRDGRDHRDLGGLGKDQLDEINVLLDRFAGDRRTERVLTLELFSAEDLTQSVEILAKLLERR